MVDAVISEIVTAAGNDMAAKTQSERPSYVVNQTFQGPVASVAHGNASVGSVSQTVASATPHELAEAVAAIIRSLPASTTPESVSAKAELETAETELRKGRVPVGCLTRLLKFFSKTEDIAIRAPEAMHHIATLGSMIGLG